MDLKVYAHCTRDCATSEPIAVSIEHRLTWDTILEREIDHGENYTDNTGETLGA